MSSNIAIVHYAFIVEPNTQEKVPIDSNHGRELLFSYVEKYKEHRDILTSIRTRQFGGKQINK